MSDEKRRIVSPDELVRRRGDEVFMNQLQVKGTAVIKDKDGNVKGKLNITSIEIQEDEENANN